MELIEVSTIADLALYLTKHPSSVVRDMFVQVIKFFSVECRHPSGVINWQEVKRRRKLRLPFRLEASTPVDEVVLGAFINWMLHPHYGHDLGCGFDDALLSHRQSGISDPRQEFWRIIKELRIGIQTRTTN